MGLDERSLAAGLGLQLPEKVLFAPDRVLQCIGRARFHRPGFLYQGILQPVNELYGGFQ
jgi:hypothetical protein